MFCQKTQGAITAEITRMLDHISNIRMAALSRRLLFTPKVTAHKSAKNSKSPTSQGSLEMQNCWPKDSTRHQP